MAAAGTAKAKGEALKAAKVAVTESTLVHREAKAALKAAAGEQKAGDAFLAAADGKKAKLEEAQNTVYNPIKEGTAEKDQIDKGIATLLKLGREFGFDATMLTSLPGALGKAVDARGGFDGMVLSSVEDEMKKHINQCSEELSNGESSTAERAAKVASAQQQLETASTTEAESKTAVEECLSALKEAETSERDALKAVEDFDCDMAQVVSDLQSEKESLDCLRAGAMGVFKELSDRSKNPPQEKVEEMDVAPDVAPEAAQEAPVA